MQRAQSGGILGSRLAQADRFHLLSRPGSGPSMAMVGQADKQRDAWANPLSFVTPGLIRSQASFDRYRPIADIRAGRLSCRHDEASDAQAGGGSGVKVLALALLLTACVPPYARMSLTSHGPIIWSRHKTLADCERTAAEEEQLNQGSGFPYHRTRCVTRQEARAASLVGL